MSEPDELRPQDMTIALTPGEQPPANLPAVLSRLMLKIRTPHGAELEIPLSEISMYGAAPIFGPRTLKLKCPNCHEKLPMTGDPEENHHTAMRHRLVCTKREEATLENERLVTEFRAQPNIVEQTIRLEAERARFRLQAPGRPRAAWWKFWRW